MATVDKTGGAVFTVPVSGLNRFFVMNNVVDISAALTADVYQVLPVVAGVQVLNVSTKVVTPNNAATTSVVDVGDGTDPNGFDNQVDMKAAAGTLSIGLGGTDAYITTVGKMYAANDTIDLVFTVTGTNTAGSVEVRALCANIWE